MPKVIFGFILAMVLSFPAAGFGKDIKLPPNQLMVAHGKGIPIVAQRILFTPDFIVIQFSRDRVATNSYGSLKVLYTDNSGKPHEVFIDHESGYIVAGEEIIPFPAKLVNLTVYDPFIDD